MSGTRGDIAQIEAWLREGRADEAARAVARMLQFTPRVPRLHELMARAAQALGDFRTMTAAARALRTLREDRAARLLLVEALLLAGEKTEARDLLANEQTQAVDDPDALLRIAELHGQCVAHEEALVCYRRAAELAPDDSGVLYALAASLVANGELGEGESAYRRSIAFDPGDADAHYNLSTVRRWSRDCNQIDALRQRLATIRSGAREEVALCYALAKELEDLGEWQESFRVLQRGASARRKRLAYRVEGDEQAMRLLGEVFDDRLVSRAPAVEPHAGPVFVLGLPRSGTTLVERILGTHASVACLGEINDLALGLLNTLGRSAAKPDLIRQSAHMDFADLGARYLRATRGYGKAAPLLVDKNPLNFLYLGLIRLALPGARVIHLRREPMDCCFAMYKTLFRMGYPFSYDLQDLGRYHTAYARLMTHWHALCPGFILDVDYERLVGEPREQVARILGFCGLPWDERCLEFHARPGAAATASAAQVREPIHNRSVGRWRRNAAELVPLQEALAAASAAGSMA